MPHALKKLQNLISYAVIRVLRGLLLLLGLERASAFMGWCWGTFAPFTKRHPRALTQLEAAMPELSNDEREQIVRTMWSGLGSTFAEGLLLDRLMMQPERIIVEDSALTEKLQSAPATQHGLIFVSMHSGNWEALGVPIAHAGLNVAGLYQAVQNPMMERFLMEQRQSLYRAGMISKGSHAMKRIVSLLKSGDAVAMLADQRQANRGVLVPFFGLAAPSTPLPAMLALKTGAQLILGRCKRVGRVRYAIELKPVKAEKTDDHEADIERVTAAIHAQFEDWIRERPHEWMWAHRRWSRNVRTPDTEKP